RAGHTERPALSVYVAGAAHEIVAGRLGTAVHREAEERHELVVDALLEAAHADDVRAAELVVEADIEDARALEPQVLSGEGGERALGRQPRPHDRGRQELLGAGSERALGDVRGDVRVVIEG